MSGKKKTTTDDAGDAGERQPVNNSPIKRIQKECRKATEALANAEAYATANGFTWIELAQILRQAQDAITAAWGYASRESLRPPGEQEES